MKVLVDSSVWIDYFRNGNDTRLESLISEDLVVTNELILTELIPALISKKQKEVIESLENFERIPLVIDWETIRRQQVLNMQNGINKVGIPDLILLQQTIENNLILFSLDKHFQLMQKHSVFKLF